MNWERLGRDRIFSGRVVEVVRDQVRISDPESSRETTFEVVHHPGAAAILPLHDDGTVSMLFQYRYAIDDRIWEIPAGSLTPGETFLDCAAREIVEEAGLRARRWVELASFYPSPGFCDEELRIYLALSLTPASAERDVDEDFEVRRVPFAQALEWSRTGEIRDAKSMIALLLAARHPQVSSIVDDSR